MTVEPVGDVVAGLGEGPCWDAATRTLLWVDIPGGAVHRTDPVSGQTTTTWLGAPVSAVLPDRSGDLVVLRRDRIVRLGTGEVLGALDLDPAVRFNDAKCDPSGRLWAGTMHTAKQPGTAALYRLDPDGLRAVVSAVTISNGFGWSPDRTRMYYIDTPTRCVDVFDVSAAGELANRRHLVDLRDEDPSVGRPDGMTVDRDGMLWVALIGGAALRRYRPDGVLDRVVPLPVSHPTSCAFGGPDGGDLFVTTARDPVPDTERAAQPLAGRLLRLRPGPTGDAATPYRG